MTNTPKYSISQTTQSAKTQNNICNLNQLKVLKDYNRLVYVEDKAEGYLLGKLIDIGVETLTIQLFDQLKTIVNYFIIIF